MGPKQTSKPEKQNQGMQDNNFEFQFESFYSKGDKDKK